MPRQIQSLAAAAARVPERAAEACTQLFARLEETRAFLPEAAPGRPNAYAPSTPRASFRKFSGLFT